MNDRLRIVVPVPAPRRLLNASLAALEGALVRGQHAVAAAPARVERDLRVWEVEAGLVWLVSERAWFAYVLNGAWPESVAWPLAAVWVEQDPLL